MHAVLPALVVIEPGSHTVHFPAVPGWAVKEPLSQLLHEDSVSLYLPASQAAHTVLPVAVVI